MYRERKKLFNRRDYNRNCFKIIIFLIIILLLVFVGMEAHASSKYDNNISKYDIKSHMIDFKVENDYCIKTSLKEKEAILSDLKSGRLKVKKNPELNTALYFSNNFKSGKEYLYFESIYGCKAYLGTTRYIYENPSMRYIYGR